MAEMSTNAAPTSAYRSPTALPEHPVLNPLVQTPRFAHTLARNLVALLLISALGAMFLPWQQSARGGGRVVAYAPLERQQVVEAPIEGRIVTWWVQEGSRVERGDRIAELSDNDPEIMNRLERERDATRSRLEAAQRSIDAQDRRVTSLKQSRSAVVSSADARVLMAQERLRAVEQALAAAHAAEKTALLNLERQQQLAARGLSSQRDLELAQLTHTNSVAEVERARASLAAARSEVVSIQAERNRADADAAAAIEAAITSLQSAHSDEAKAQGELAQVEVRLSRQNSMVITAPRAGTILRLIAKAGTEMVHAGDGLAVLVPDTEARAVELWVAGNDAPLVTAGRKVRLQFEGWPAVQFAGWPSVAVGTFGGVVSFVDATDDGHGRFRVLVVPTSKDRWPDGKYLKQGVRTNGWVLLNQVSLGFELWRQFNGFPPSLGTLPQATEQTTDAKPAKKNKGDKDK